MTAITHVHNYTVRCPHYQENQKPADWHNHIEVNHSCEIALNRITKWHNNAGSKLFEIDGITIRKADKEEAYFAMQSSRLKHDGHGLVTFKVFLDNCCQDVSVNEVMEYLIKDYQQRITKID
ncbi:cytoplasmic protein [Shewanella aestuarii]|uniref:Cytoplasmic protein n=1 Tax=Shewanella aestuarii TaxID=1028752 RepID=A0A6G9QIP8_9GAMM|nr:cytoplasmic protein [Shewanella aestuarii]QIR14013.1 cytoplasmic protein [Shewanella aestuarii]